MRIVCPSCQAEYEVPDALLHGAHRPVRCARCAAEWTPAAPVQPDAPPVLPVVPALPPPDRGPSLAEEAPLPTSGNRRRASAIAPLAAWLVTLALIITIGWSLVKWRAPIMAFWPKSQLVYGWLGLG